MISPNSPSPATSQDHWPEHYRGRNVLVIGGSGFMGFNLVRRLVDLGAKVSIASRGITVPADRLPPSVDALRLDLADPSTYSHILSGRDMIFIVAGATGAVRSVALPVDDLLGNLTGQLTLLEAIRRLPKPPRVVMAGSRLVYGTAHYLPVDESHPTNPTSAYGVHKLTAEKYHLLFHRLHGVSTTVARVTVSYGPHVPAGNSSHGVVDEFASSLLRGDPIFLYGTGEQSRDFIHIDDVVEGLLRIGACDQTIGRTLNLGHGRPITLLALAQTLINIIGCGDISHVPWPGDAEKVETGNFYTDVSLIRHLTGWAPRVELEDGLRHLLNYMRNRQPAPVSQHAM
ncbi:MAG: NAD-dependent epimerase/dehydratase family protein [Tepidisphaeraceae bacterium]|jgi:nucleoside-diphosphate-sugar epimerase